MIYNLCACTHLSALDLPATRLDLGTALGLSVSCGCTAALGLQPCTHYQRCKLQCAAYPIVDRVCTHIAGIHVFLKRLVLSDVLLGSVVADLHWRSAPGDSRGFFCLSLPPESSTLYYWLFWQLASLREAKCRHMCLASWQCHCCALTGATMPGTLSQHMHSLCRACAEAPVRPGKHLRSPKCVCFLSRSDL